MKFKFVFFFLILLFSVNSYCQEDDMDTTQIEKRIQIIEKMLSYSKTNINTWNYGWLSAYSGATVVQGVIAVGTKDLSTRQDMILGAGTTLLGAGFQALNQINTSKDAETLLTLSDSTLEQKIEKLKKAEALLEKNAKKEIAGRSLQTHALNTAVNFGSGLIIWLGFKRSVWDGVTNFLINSAVTELQIWTQPTRTARDYKYYVKKYIEGDESAKLNPQTELLVKPYSGGIALVLNF